MASPTSRTLAALRADGWIAEVVERWLPFARRRRDLLGFIDVLALRLGDPLLAIQTTSASNHASRVAKLKASPELALWLRCGHAAQVWSWRRRAGHWQCRREEMQLQDTAVNAVAVTTPRRPRRGREGEGDHDRS
jgi:hypothetical protein